MCCSACPGNLGRRPVSVWRSDLTVLTGTLVLHVSRSPKLITCTQPPSTSCSLMAQALDIGGVFRRDTASRAGKEDAPPPTLEEELNGKLRELRKAWQAKSHG